MGSFTNHVDMAGPGGGGLPNVHITTNVVKWSTKGVKKPQKLSTWFMDDDPNSDCKKKF